MNKRESRKDNMTEEDRDIQWASAHFLTDSLPDDWQNMSDEEIDEFLADHVWQPLEDWDVKDVWQQIGQIARSMRSYIDKQKG